MIPANLMAICNGTRTDLSPEARESYRSICDALTGVKQQRVMDVSVIRELSAKTRANGTTVKTEDRKQALLRAFPCSHRSDEPVRADVSNLCGTRGDMIDIFACDLHKECSLSKYCFRQTVRTCMGCSDISRPLMDKPFPQQRGPNPFSVKAQIPEFVSMEQLMSDVRILASRVPPETSKIIGVARSGVSVASMVAMLLHLPLLIVRQSKNDIVDAGNGWRLTGNTGGNGSPVVIDDTVMSGNSFKQVMPVVWSQFPGAISAAVYVNPATRQKPDIWVRDLPWPHILEWNMFNSVMSSSIAVDFDGVLCADCAPEDDDDGERYRGFLLTATPKYVIRKVRVPLIVTARLERWRPETEQWLANHGIAADKIIMGPWKDNAQRAHVDIGRWKGMHFKTFLSQVKRRVQPAMFVESEERQAIRIAEVSRGLVVCPAAKRCYHV